MKRAIEFSIAGAVLIALCGCGSLLAPRPDLTRFYMLTARSSDVAGIAAAPAAGLVIGLGPVNLPDYLTSRDQIVTRVSPNRLELSPNARWAEPLDVNFRGALAANLNALFPGAQIVSYPWYDTTHVDYQVEVKVERFEQLKGGDAELLARWTVLDGKNGKLLLSEQTREAQAPRGSSTIASVAALSADLGALSDQIGGALRLTRQRRAASAAGAAN